MPPPCIDCPRILTVQNAPLSESKTRSGARVYDSADAETGVEPALGWETRDGNGQAAHLVAVQALFAKRAHLSRSMRYSCETELGRRSTRTRLHER